MKKRFDYFCIPSKQQHDFCLVNYDLFNNPALQSAANNVISGYHNDEAIPVDFIVMVNQMLRKF